MALTARLAMASCRVCSPWAVRRHLGSLRFRWLARRLPPEFVERGCIFVHVPKAAGHSIATALFGRVIGHRTLADYESVAADAVANAFVFTFVRDPWDRLHSAYHYLCNGGTRREPDASFGRLLAARYPTFERFVHEFLDARTVHAYYHFVPQHCFLDTRRDACAPDFVGRFEALEEGFRHVAERIGVTAELPTLNRSGARDHRSAYTSAMWQRVGELYQRDCERFGYSG